MKQFISTIISGIVLAAILIVPTYGVLIVKYFFFRWDTFWEKSQIKFNKYFVL